MGAIHSLLQNQEHSHSEGEENSVFELGINWIFDRIFKVNDLPEQIMLGLLAALSYTMNLFSALSSALSIWGQQSAGKNIFGLPSLIPILEDSSGGDVGGGYDSQSSPFPNVDEEVYQNSSGLNNSVFRENGFSDVDTPIFTDSRSELGHAQGG